MGVVRVSLHRSAAVLQRAKLSSSETSDEVVEAVQKAAHLYSKDCRVESPELPQSLLFYAKPKQLGILYRPCILRMLLFELRPGFLSIWSLPK